VPGAEAEVIERTILEIREQKYLQKYFAAAKKFWSVAEILEILQKMHFRISKMKKVCKNEKSSQRNIYAGPRTGKMCKMRSVAQKDSRVRM